MYVLRIFEHYNNCNSQKTFLRQKREKYSGQFCIKKNSKKKQNKLITKKNIQGFFNPGLPYEPEAVPTGSAEVLP